MLHNEWFEMTIQIKMLKRYCKVCATGSNVGYAVADSPLGSYTARAAAGREFRGIRILNADT